MIGNDGYGSSSSDGKLNVELVNNDGGGFADYVKVNRGTTVGGLFNQKMTAGANPAKYSIRVNGEQKSSTYELREGDKVSITPLKVQGA
jgi:hypothetical protein